MESLDKDVYRESKGVYLVSFIQETGGYFKHTTLGAGKMKKYKADVVVTLKKGVRDPQGTAVDTILRRTGLEESASVQVGKFFTLSGHRK